MMLELLKKRRSIRKYKPEKISPEHIKQLQTAVLLSPTSKNNQSWEFIFVEDEKLLQELALCKTGGAAFVSQAPLVVVVLGNPEATDVWIEDASIAATILHLTATDLGLGSCWVQIRLRDKKEEESSEYIKKLLNIPEPYQVLSMVAIGHPAQVLPGHSEDELKYHKVSENKFGNIK